MKNMQSPPSIGALSLSTKTHKKYITMKKIKSLTLSLEEITDILSIDDPGIRRAAIDALHDSAADPESIDLEKHLDGPSVVLTLVHKVHRRAEAAKKRAETRAKNIKKHKEAQPRPDEKAGQETVELKINENIFRKILWTKQNYSIAVNTVLGILSFLKDTDKTAQVLFDTLTDIHSSLGEYLRPLTKVASDYFRIPKHHRPAAVTIPA